jgi:hypothetical protein
VSPPTALLIATKTDALRFLRPQGDPTWLALIVRSMQLAFRAVAAALETFRLG